MRRIGGYTRTLPVNVAAGFFMSSTNVHDRDTSGRKHRHIWVGGVDGGQRNGLNDIVKKDERGDDTFGVIVWVYR